MRIVTCLLVLCLTGAIATAAAGQPQASDLARLNAAFQFARAFRLPADPELRRVSDQLELTQDQDKTLSDLIQKYTNRAKDLTVARNDAAKEYVHVLADPQAAAEKITAALDKALRAEAAISENAAKFWVEFRGLLTAGQIPRLQQVLARASARVNMPPPP